MEIKKVKLKNGTTIYFKEINGELIEVEASELGRRFIPCDNEWFWYVGVDGDVEKSRIFYPYNSEDNNCFRTEEEAKRKKEIIDFIYSKRKLFTKKEWEDLSIAKRCVTIDFNKKDISVSLWWNEARHIYYFETYEIAQEVINFVGYEDWIKYVLNIYED